jgi:hypothetical protein
LWCGTSLGLDWTDGLNLRPRIGFGWTDCGLSGTIYFGRASWLDLRTLVGLAGAGYLAGACAGLNCGLAGTIDFGRAGVGIGPGDAGLGCDGTRGGNHGGAALVDVVELGADLCGFALVGDLRCHGWSARAAEGCDFGGLRTDVDASAASVISDAGVVVDDYGAVVDVGDVDADAVDGAVVIEGVSVPVAAVIAVAGIAEAVVDASVEADVWAPVAAAPSPAIVIPAPVAGGPEGSVVGRGAPCSGDPVIAGGGPVPVTRGPEVVGGGGYGLVVDREWGRGLVGVFDGRGFAVLFELVVGLGVLVGLVLIGWRGRRGCVLVLRGWRQSLLGYLLRLRAEGDGLVLSGSGGDWLRVVDGGQVGVGGVGAGVIRGGGGGGVLAAAGGSGEQRDDSE